MVARTLGASPSRAFLTIGLPLARRGLLASGVLTWAKALGEFGATIMVAGTMAMRTETLPMAIYMRLSSADIEGTVALILVLLAIGLSCPLRGEVPLPRAPCSNLTVSAHRPARFDSRTSR